MVWTRSASVTSNSFLQTSSSHHCKNGFALKIRVFTKRLHSATDNIPWLSVVEKLVFREREREEESEGGRERLGRKRRAREKWKEIKKRKRVRRRDTEIQKEREVRERERKRECNVLEREERLKMKEWEERDTHHLSGICWGIWCWLWDGLKGCTPCSDLMKEETNSHQLRSILLNVLYTLLVVYRFREGKQRTQTGIDLDHGTTHMLMRKRRRTQPFVEQMRKKVIMSTERLPWILTVWGYQ